jgi:hypothetical protein
MLYHFGPVVSPLTHLDQMHKLVSPSSKLDSWHINCYSLLFPVIIRSLLPRNTKPYKNTYIHTCIHTSSHESIHVGIHSYMHPYIYLWTQVLNLVLLKQCTSMPTYQIAIFRLCTRYLLGPASTKCTNFVPKIKISYEVISMRIFPNFGRTCSDQIQRNI